MRQVCDIECFLRTGSGGVSPSETIIVQPSSVGIVHKDFTPFATLALVPRNGISVFCPDGIIICVIHQSIRKFFSALLQMRIAHTEVDVQCTILVYGNRSLVAGQQIFN